MSRLTLLGDVDLRLDDGTPVGSVLSQPRRLGLLAHIAIESTGAGVPAEKLFTLLWPEKSQDRARAALNTAVYFLRRSLGDVVPRQGGLVGLDAGGVTCDVVEFREAVARGDAAGALALYRGDLLQGWHADGVSPEFERWMDETRSSLRRAALEAAWSLAEEAVAAARATEAGAWARRALELADGDEAAVRRGIELLGRVGDREGALEAYRSLEQRLHAEYDAAPSQATRQAMEAVRTAESTLAPAGPVVPIAPAAGPAVVPAPGRAAGASGWRRVARRAGSAAVSVVLILAFYSLWGLTRSDGGRVAEAGGDRRLVVQLDEVRDFSSDGASAGLAGALGVELGARLGGVHRLVVATGETRASGGGAPSFIVQGGLVRVDSAARVTLVLVDAASGATLDRVTAEGTDHPTSIDAMAEALAAGVRRGLGRAVDAAERVAGGASPRALELVRGALADARSADSLAGTGAVEAMLALLDAADAQLARAQAEARRWAEPSIRRAELAHQRMWLHLVGPGADPEALAAALRTGVGHADAALAIDPRDPGALEARGTLHYWTWRTRAGGSPRADQDALVRAEADLARAADLDPGRARAWSLLSAMAESRGDFAAANAAARRAHRGDAYLADTQDILLRLFTTSLELGDYAAAREWCAQIGKDVAAAWTRAHCSLEYLAWHGVPTEVGPADVEALVAAGSSGPHSRLMRPHLELLGAVALARSGYSMEARAAIDAAGAAHGSDPQLLQLEAWARLALGEEEAAAALLRQAIDVNPRLASRCLNSRRFVAIRDRVIPIQVIAAAR